MVDTQLIRYTSAVTGQRIAYLTPPKAQAYVVAFDAGDPIAPFSFWVDKPVHLRQTVRTERGKTAHRKRADERAKARREGRAPKEIEVEGSGPTREQVADADAVRPAPLVFRRKQRTYGMRALRANREAGRGDTAALPRPE
jgi:hypothetical protein